MIVTPEKRNSLIKLGIGTLLILAAVWFFLVSPTKDRTSKAIQNAGQLASKLSSKKKVIERAGRIDALLLQQSEALREIEDQMVSGDTYRWIIKLLRSFEIPDQIEFSRYDPPQFVESNLGNNLNYKTISYGVTGLATFHDLGAFIERLENTYPYIQIYRLEMEPAKATLNYDEKLTFLIELRVLTKAEGSRS